MGHCCRSRELSHIVLVRPHSPGLTSTALPPPRCGTQRTMYLFLFMRFGPVKQSSMKRPNNVPAVAAAAINRADTTHSVAGRSTFISNIYLVLAGVLMNYFVAACSFHATLAFPP